MASLPQGNHKPIATTLGRKPADGTKKGQSQPLFLYPILDPITKNRKEKKQSRRTLPKGQIEEHPQHNHTRTIIAGERIQPREKKSLENLAAYLIRATFSQKRMDYSPDEATVVYRSKDGKEKKTYDALEWLAAMGTHVPDRCQQSVRHYGLYANSTPGRLRKRKQVKRVPTLQEPVKELQRTSGSHC